MARFQTRTLFDMNLGLSKRVRELVERDVLDYYRKQPHFKGKVVVATHCQGTLKVTVYWEDPLAEEHT